MLGRRGTTWWQCLLAVSLVSIPATADYGTNEREFFVRHAKHDLEFSQAPILVRERTGSREDAIRRVHAIARKMTGEPADAKLYDAELVIGERRRLLDGMGSSVPSRFHKEGQAGDVQVVESEEGTTIRSEGRFNIRVYGSGDAFRVVNENPFPEGSRNLPFRLTESEGEAEGLRLIRDLELVPKADYSTLRFIKTRYIHFTGRGGNDGDRVVATEIYFSRTIAGVPVIGPKGSLIKLELRANDRIESMTVDWGQLSPAPENVPVQRVVGADRFEQRFKGYTRSNWASKAPNFVVRKKICGYIDFGTAYTDQEVLQLGCQMSLMTNQAESTKHLAWIPLGESPVADPTWNEAVRVKELEAAGRDEMSGATKQTTATTRAPVEQAGPGEAEAESGCSMGRVARGRGSYAAMAGALLGLILAKRRRARHVCQRPARLGARLIGGWPCLGAALLCATWAPCARAEFNNFDMNVYMMKHYVDDPDDQCVDFSPQWENYDEFVDEMDDEADCYDCQKNPSGLYWLLGGYWRDTGHFADIVAVSTHGHDKYSGSEHIAWMRDRICNRIYLSDVYPADEGGSDIDMYLLFSCAIFETDNLGNWYTFRNLFHTGAGAAAGCWSSDCSIHNTSWNSTWNEIGDQLADIGSTVRVAWANGFSVGDSDDDIIIIGSGRYGYSECDDHAHDLRLSNRNAASMTGPSYSLNRAPPSQVGDPQTCGYYWSNI